MTNNKIKYLGLVLAFLILVSAVVITKWQVDKNAPVPEQAKIIPIDNKISFAQLEQNKTSHSCWIGVKKKVYDLTKYEINHIGGKALFNGCGKEIDSLFPNHPGGRFDTNKNLEKILPYYIGELVN